jgi:hypothetical protein
MAQRKTPPPSRTSGTRPTGSKTTGTKSTGTGTKPAGKPSLQKPPPTRPAVRKPPPRKGKSIVNQKQTPWGLIAATVAVVLFAAAVVVVVIVTHKSSNNQAGGKCLKQIGSNSNTYLNKDVCAIGIKGVTFKQEPNRQHLTGHIKYDSTPPVGGNHNPFWADCTGTVYPIAIANENAVHMLEHGAVWITYNAKTLPASGVAELKKYVSGQDRMAMSPYPNLKTPISLQAWGYQLFLKSASDPRIAKFIADLRYNPVTTPEYGATCSNSAFKEHPSTFGHPESSA